jgi:hypothetical protein
MTTITHQTAETQFIEVDGATLLIVAGVIQIQSNLLCFFFNISVVV